MNDSASTQPERLTDVPALLAEARAHLERRDKPAATEVLKQLATAESATPDALVETARLLAQVGANSAAADCYLRAGITYLYDDVEIAKARQTFASAYALDPQNLDILFHMGQADVVEGRTQEALAKFKDVLRKSNVGHLPALFEAGCVYQALGQFDQAILAFKRVMEHDRNHVQAIVHMGQLHQSKGMRPEAIGYYVRAAELARDLKQSGTARQLAGLILALDVRNQKARYIIDEVDQQGGPQAAQAAEAGTVIGEDSALARFVSRATPKARLDLQSQVEQLTATIRHAEPQHGEAARVELESLRAELGAVRQNLATLREESVRLAKAKAADELAIAELAAVREELASKTESLHAQCEQAGAEVSKLSAELTSLREARRAEEAALAAVQSQRQALEAEPEKSGRGVAAAGAAEQALPASARARGEMLLATGQHEQALDAFRQAVQADPEDAVAAYQLACLLADSGDLEAAQQLLESVADRRPDHLAARFRLALTKASRGVVEEGVADLLRIAKYEPGGAQFLDQFVEYLERAAADGSPQAKYRLGVAYRELGRVEEALAVLQSIQNVPELSVLCLVAIGLCLRRQGLDGPAARRFQKAVDTPGLPDRQYYEALYNLGEIYEMKADPESLALALSSFEELYARDLSFRDVAERVRAVRAKVAGAARSKVKPLPKRSGDAPRQ